MQQSNHTQGASESGTPNMSGLAKAGVAAATAAALGQSSQAAAGDPGPCVLVQLYLRGGADALTLCVPEDEDNYHQRRSATRVYASTDTSPEAAGKKGTLIEPKQEDSMGNLTRTGFSLAPAFSSMKLLYDAGKLAFVHGVGGVDPTRSHFSQQAYTELGETSQTNGATGTGWLGRYLELKDAPSDGSLRALGLNRFAIQSYAGGNGVIPTLEPESFQLPSGLGSGLALKNIYASSINSLKGVLDNDLDAMSKLMAVTWDPVPPPHYPSSKLGREFWKAFQVIRDDAEIEVISLDYDNIEGKRWDTHESQGVFDGTMAELMADLSGALTGFQQDVDSLTNGKRVVVLVYSEFGRTLDENDGLGTDHGRGGLAMLIGNEVRVSQVYTDPVLWQGLADGGLDPQGVGDQAVTIDIRDIQSEVMEKCMGVAPADIFPDTDYTYFDRKLLK